jgi:hypothetical protein
MSFLKQIVLAVLTLAVLASCDHKMAMVTDVHADGSLDKTIVQEGGDKPYKNKMMGVGEETGWAVKVEKLDSGENDGGASRITFQKRFSSAAEANAELATPNDTLFRVTSTFEKKFRWFYTHLYYADTYHSLNRLSYPPIDDYLTKEDFAFIDRLPAEGKPIAKADSLYLERLEDKLFEIYAGTAIFEIYYTTAQKLLRENEMAPRWLDTLRVHKKDMLNELRGDNDMNGNFMLNAMDGLGIPLPDDAGSQFDVMIKPVERITNFISTAHDGTYQHAIHMPWNVVRTNADSVSGRMLFWSPPSIKFLVKDYTMYAEARQMNYWAIALSAALIGFTVYLFVRRRPAQHRPAL